MSSTVRPLRRKEDTRLIHKHFLHVANNIFLQSIHMHPSHGGIPQKSNINFLHGVNVQETVSILDSSFHVFNFASRKIIPILASEVCKCLRQPLGSWISTKMDREPPCRHALAIRCIWTPGSGCQRMAPLP